MHDLIKYQVVLLKYQYIFNVHILSLCKILFFMCLLPVLHAFLIYHYSYTCWIITGPKFRLCINYIRLSMFSITHSLYLLDFRIVYTRHLSICVIRVYAECIRMRIYAGIHAGMHICGYRIDRRCRAGIQMHAVYQIVAAHVQICGYRIPPCMHTC